MMQFPYFSSDKGGQTSGIIVTRATGCPEEEVRAELYARVQGQRGSRVGGFHFFPSSLSPSSRVSLHRGAASSTQDAVTLLHQAARSQIGQVKLQWLTQIKPATMTGIWKPKVVLDCRKLEPRQSLFLGSASRLFLSRHLSMVNG